MLTATVSGSFHRHLHAITSAVKELTDLGVRVLSPADPRIVAGIGDFLFVASDRVRSVRMVQDRHIESIRVSDFLWLVAPDGYVGQSASMELGFAVASGVRILGQALPGDITLREYVRQVSTVKEAVQLAGRQPKPRAEGFLINPHASIQEAHDLLIKIDRASSQQDASPAEDSRATIYNAARRFRRMFDFAA